MAKFFVLILSVLSIGFASASPMAIQSSGNLCDICGKSPLYSSRIFNGREAYDGELPWRVSVHNHVKGSVCGGTIISKNWVLTAGHCVPTVTKGKEGEAKMTIRAGTLDLFSGGQTFDVDGFSVIQNENYRLQPIANDTALVRVPGFDFSNQKIKPICLPYIFRNVAVSGQALASGWGITIKGENQPKSKLRTAVVSIGDQEECSRVMESRGYSRSFPEKHMCLTKSNTGICSGDSGGSIDAQVKGRFYTVGINSYVINECGSPNNVDVVVRVASWLDWIERNTGETFCKN